MFSSNFSPLLQYRHLCVKRLPDFWLVASIPSDKLTVFQTPAQLYFPKPLRVYNKKYAGRILLKFPEKAAHNQVWPTV